MTIRVFINLDGARPEFLLDFEKDFKDVKKIVLDTNYRSTELIIKLGKKIIDNNKVRYTKDEKVRALKAKYQNFFRQIIQWMRLKR